jgi:uncharacterized membrane protein YphA (DoxX/SURF4 family)
VIFLVPVTLVMHNFWSVSDPMMRQVETANFMKNVTMLGGALVISYFGAGPLSLDALLFTKEPRHITRDQATAPGLNAISG